MRKRFWIYLAILLLLIGVTAKVNLDRQPVLNGDLQIVYGQNRDDITLSELETVQVIGSRVNGKGQEINVDAVGLSLQTVLKHAKITNFTQTKAIANDGYSAVVLVEELQDAYLIEEDDGLRLVVFGDTDSKRSVTGVVQLVIE